MNGLFPPGAAVPEICRGFLQVGIGVLIQSTLLLLCGLLAARRLRSRGPSPQSLVYRAALVAVVVSAPLTLFLAGSFQPFWSVSLPSSRTADGALPAPRIAVVAAPAGEIANSVAPAVTPRAAEPASIRPAGAPAVAVDGPRACGLGCL